MTLKVEGGGEEKWPWVLGTLIYEGVSLERGKIGFKPVLYILVYIYIYIYIYIYTHTHTPFFHSHANFFIYPLNSVKKLFLSIKTFGEAFSPTFPLKLRLCVSSWALLGTLCTVLGCANE